MPSVSVIVPCYNAKKFIPDFIRQLCSQTFEDWEAIFVDDASTDGTANVISESARTDNRIRSLNNTPNSGGPYMPRCVGLREANAPFTCFLDIDDDINPGYLESLVARKLETDARIVFPDMKTGNESLTKIDLETVYRGRDLVKHTLFGWEIGCNGGLYDTDFVRRIYLEDIPELCRTELPDLINQSVPIARFVRNLAGDPYPRYVDEVGTRIALERSGRVAFAADAVYTYNVGEDSISSCEKIDSVAFLINDFLLSRWIDENFTDKPTVGSVYSQQFYGVIDKMKLLGCLRHKINPDKYSQARDFIQEMFRLIDRKKIKPYVGFPLFALTSMGFRMAEFLLPLHGSKGWRPERGLISSVFEFNHK